MLRKFSEDEAFQLEQAVHIEAQRGLYCANCLGFITEPGSSMEIQGSHLHTCTNPAQLTFTIGCFSDAPGCNQYGEPTADHTWFTGYRWNVALCAACSKHLGWIFHGPVHQFYGLIVRELVEK